MLTQKGPIGIIAAMPLECEAVLRCIKHSKRIRLGPLQSYRFSLSTQEIWLVRSGIGMKQARKAAQTLLDTLHPQTLISFGIAGAIRQDLKIGDVVHPKATWFLGEIQDAQKYELAQVSEPAWNAAAQVLLLKDAKLVQGIAITTRGSQIVPESLKAEDFPILEMETYGIAQIAAAKGIPVIAWRGISDNPLEPIPFDLNELVEDDSHLRVGKLIHMLIAHPRGLLQALRLQQNSIKAARQAAISLVAALSQP
jgi:adenosylhomocysteine nucleosidase